jgi:acyl-CoA synthetase (AMP-forming)/AMP-acid ligase II
VTTPEVAARERWERDEPRRRLTLPEVLADHARRRPDATAFSFLPDGETVASELTFAELDDRARTLASHLRAHEGQRAILIYASSPEFVVALFACLYAGVVAVHVPLDTSNPGRAHARVAVVAAAADASLVLSARDEPRERAGPLGHLPRYATDALDTDPTHRDDGRLPAARLDRLALIQFTSGTTGTARGVPLRHSHLTVQASSLQAGINSDPTSVMVGWTPLFHDMGLFLGVLAPVYAGHRSVVIFPLAFLARPRRWLEAMTRFRGTISGGPNFAYDLLARDPAAADGLDLSSWRVAFIGGEQIRPATLDRFAGAFAPAGFDPVAFDPAYGLAEATCGVSGRGFCGPGVRRFDPAGLRAGRAVETPAGQPLASAGYLRGDHEALIVEPQGRTAVPDGTIGELWIRGAGVADGYWNDAEETARVFGARLAGTDDGPFLRTGDLAFRVGDELFIAGRMKELIIHQGRNLFPHDVEATVQASHPALRPGCGAAFAVDGDHGELLVVAQEVRPTAVADPAEIKDAIRTAVRADHQIETHAIVLLPPRSLPKTTSGKIQRKLCRTAYLTGDWPLRQAR